MSSVLIYFMGVSTYFRGFSLRRIFHFYVELISLVVSAMDFTVNRIKQIMKKQGIIQADLAEITGISQGDLSKIINGKKERVSLMSAAKISKALGYSVEHIWPKLFS